MFGFDIPHGIVWFVFIFMILAIFIAMWIGNPLIRYNYENKKLNGDYRYSLILVRDHAESVAFYSGEQHEHGRLSDRFKAIIRNRWRIARQSVCLSGFNDMFTNGIKLFLIILQAPRLFAGQIKIGDIQQTVQAFARLQNALSFFRMFYNKFTACHARLERLYVFLLSTEEQHGAQQPEISEVSDGIALENVALFRHNGEVLLDGINIKLKKRRFPADTRPERFRQNLAAARAGGALAVRQQRQSQPSAASRHPLPAATPVHGTRQPARRGLLPRYRQTASRVSRSHEHLPLGLSD